MSYGPIDLLDGFILFWPTETFVITQPYGNDWITEDGVYYYASKGLPDHHEGVDCRAKHGSKIFASHDGVVSLVQPTDNGKAYGIHARVTTEYNGEQLTTVYAHFLKALVKQGQSVVAGQVLGYADNTGWSSGDHLHLGLKMKGALERGYTRQPGDWIDPTPYLRMRYPPKPYPEDGRLEYMKTHVWNKPG